MSHDIRTPMNILSNAVKYTPQEGHIRLEIHETQRVGGILLF